MKKISQHPLYCEYHKGVKDAVWVNLQTKKRSMKRIVIEIVTARAIPHYGNLAIHVEEGGLESKVWYPGLSRKFELIEPLLNELQIRFEEAPNEPLVERAISDLRVVQQEI